MKVKNNLFTKESAKKYIPILLLILGALLIVISYFPETKTKKNAETYSGEYETDYANMLENKLKNVLESITGENTVKVMITFESTYITSKQDKLYETSSFSIETMTNDKDVSVIKKPTPEIGGVMIVCSSLSNPEDINVIKKAAATALNIKENKIYIIGGASKQ